MTKNCDNAREKEQEMQSRPSHKEGYDSIVTSPSGVIDHEVRQKVGKDWWNS